MATWIGTLARGGVIREAREEAGIAVAAYVVGEDRLGELREWLATQPADVLRREQRAAVEICIWMAHADRDVAHEEADLLRAVVLASDLDAGDRENLLAEVGEPPPLGEVDHRLTHPTLRELMLALSWELACADGRIDPMERELHDGLARRLGVSVERAAELRDAIQEKVDSSE
jgi:tellurite resistance protein